MTELAGLTRAQQNALKQLSTTVPKAAHQLLGVSLVTLRSLVARGLARELVRDPYGVIRWAKAAPVECEMPREHQFSGVTIDQWEELVVRIAAHFTCSMCLRNGRWDTTEHPTLQEAIDKAKTDRRYVVAAIAPTGRFATLDRKKWDHFLAVKGEGRLT